MPPFKPTPFRVISSKDKGRFVLKKAIIPIVIATGATIINSCISEAVAQENLIFTSQNKAIYSELDRNVQDREKGIIASCKVSASILLTSTLNTTTSETGLIYTATDTILYQYEGVNKNDGKTNFEFCANNIKVQGLEGASNKVDSAILTFLDHDLNPTSYQHDPGALIREDTADHTVIGIVGRSSDGQNYTLMSVTVDKLPQNADLNVALSDTSIAKEVRIFNPETGERLILPQNSGSLPTQQATNPNPIIGIIGSILEKDTYDVSAQVPTVSPSTSIPPNPESPTSTLDALANVDLRNPSTFPAEIQEYMRTRQYPSQEVQDRLSREFFRPSYEKFLISNGFNETDIKALDYEHLYFQAGKTANEQGIVLPADLSLTRKIAASIQGVSNLNIDGGRYGIYSPGPKFVDPSFVDGFSMGYNYTLPIFGVNETIKHVPSNGILAENGVLFKTSEGRYVLIAHYFNTSPVDGKTTEHFIPVGVPIGQTNINFNIGLIDQNASENFNNYIFSQISPPVDFPGVNDATLGPGNPFDLATLLSKLNNASGMTIIVDGYSQRAIFPLSDDALELAVSMYINQKSAQSP